MIPVLSFSIPAVEVDYCSHVEHITPVRMSIASLTTP